MKESVSVWPRVWLTAVVVTATMLSASSPRADDDEQIRRGFEIVTEQFPWPWRLNLAGKNWQLVGLGSYLVNTTGCNDCHTHPNWAPGGNPFLGEREQINTAQYLTGGRKFGPITSANITPDNHGRPAGLTWPGFLRVMRYGHNPNDPPEEILQVMPWPLYRWKTERDLKAIYEYLSAIPSLPDNPDPGP
jgi:hypothetical protein